MADDEKDTNAGNQQNSGRIGQQNTGTERNLRCERCGITFGSWQELERHEERSHAGELIESQ